ncbi:hypothetical protein DFH08DRAFT_895131 [Mycena albidolilacea]|uniref:PPPDE domain-containing protein n=1 Tax=Mycena albidolilacea TaxID=1033008 RepID=A0AAD6ZB32_9AGAR|nr:hypothetical protein DFH08DRAFT_895131 [Mycena albidolilacea]
MAAPEEVDDDEHRSRRRQVTGFLKDELLKGKLKLEHSLGLGHKPNVIPPGTPDIRGPHRPVELGWHPVAGLAGKWFAEKTGLGKLITEKTHMCPDPTQHWAVLVGEYCHELWMDEHLNVIYINEKINREDWHTFEIGKTRFNDEALRQASEMTIFHMASARPAYNLITNNCQTFATALLDTIQIGRHREFATSFQVYREALKSRSLSKVGKLFSLGDGAVEEQEKAAGAEKDGKDMVHQAEDLPDDDAEKEGQAPPEHVLKNAQAVMDEHTTKLDNHHALFGGC